MDIKISPDQMRSIASHFDQMHNQNEQMISSLQGDVSTLETGWAGMSHTKFDSVWPSYKNHMTQLSQLLQQISQELKQTAQKLQDADEGASSGITGG